MGQPATLRLKNRSSVLSVLFQHAQPTRPWIAHPVRISTMTVNNIRDLPGQGLAEVFKPSPCPLGRPTRPVILSARAGQVIGLDAQRHQVRVVTGRLTDGDVAEEVIHLADGDDLTGRVLPVTEQRREVGHWGLPRSVTLSLPALPAQASDLPEAM